jgi:hypothetical protein
LLDFRAQCCKLVRKELAHAHNIGPPLVIGRDRGDGDCLSKSFNKVVGERIYLLEIAIELWSHLLGLVGADCWREICADSK